MNLYDSEEMLNEETMDHPFLGPNYYPGEEFFQNSKEQLHQIIDRLMKESYPIDDEDDQSFFMVDGRVSPSPITRSIWWLDIIRY